MPRTPTGGGAVYLYENVGLGDRDPTGDGAVYLYETVGLGSRNPTGQGAVYLYENPAGPTIGRGWVVGAIGWGPAAHIPMALRGYGTAVTASALSVTITLSAATQVGDTIIVVGYTNAGTPSGVTFSGAGATWATGSQGSFIYGIGTAPTAGSTTITVGYPFASKFTMLAAGFGLLSTRKFTTTGGDSVTPATVDILKGDATLVLNTVPPGGTPVTPNAAQGSVFGWYVLGGSVGTATPGFTDTNGTYTQVPVVASGNNATVELGYATLPASGGTDHVGNRTDSPTVYEGGVFVFDPA